MPLPKYRWAITLVIASSQNNVFVALFGKIKLLDNRIRGKIRFTFIDVVPVTFSELKVTLRLTVSECKLIYRYPLSDRWLTLSECKKLIYGYLSVIPFSSANFIRA